MQFGVFSGVPADDDYCFTDDKTTEVSLEQDVQQPIDLTSHRGWDQYLLKASVTESPVAVIPTVTVVVAVASGCRVVAEFTEQGVIADAARKAVVASSTVDLVVAPAAVDQVRRTRHRTGTG